MTVKVERLVNLTVALLETRRPLSFDELRTRTRFYDQSDHESARRMFERDKDDLRRLGVPVEVRDVAFGEDVGYIVDRSAYELPDVALEPDEVAALALALRAAGGADRDHLALAKIAARAPDPSDDGGDVGVRVSLDPSPTEAVADAMLDRVALRFDYRTASGQQATRTVDPYAVVQRSSAWYLVARDHDRDALRAFRIDRIVDRPRRVGQPGAFEIPDDLDVAAAVSGPDAEPVPVELAVDASLRWEAEARGAREGGADDRGRDVLRLDALDPRQDLPWLLGLGARAEVTSPASLREDLADALSAVADAHDDGDDDRGEGDRPKEGVHERD